MRTLLAFFTILVVSACSGDGSKSYSNVLSNIETVDQGAVYVFRDTGYIGSVNKMGIILNGKKIGSIGNGETIFGRSISGNNYLEVKFQGLLAMGMNATTSFAASGKENKYFIIKLDAGLLSNELELFEVSENAFRAKL